MKNLQDKVVRFGELRNWRHYHSPKNLSMALSVEASELLEIFQWLTEEQSRAPSLQQKENAASELADIFMYTLLCSHELGIDLEAETLKKIQTNEERFPLSENGEGGAEAQP